MNVFVPRIFARIKFTSRAGRFLPARRYASCRRDCLFICVSVTRRIELVFWVQVSL